MSELLLMHLQGTLAIPSPHKKRIQFTSAFFPAVFKRVFGVRDAQLIFCLLIYDVPTMFASLRLSAT